MNPATWREALTALHLLRPEWLWALLALPLLLLWWRRRWRQSSAWRQLVDPHLLPHLLEAGADRRSRAGLVVAVLAYVLAVIALAGPSWRQAPQPLWESRTPLVLVLDLSGAIRAGDLPPSRLAQARAKLATLLHRRDGGPVGLVVYAGDAFTVAPLTDDAANVALFLDALDPDVMPVDGARADRAIAHATQLLERTGARHGDILLMTGSVAPEAAEPARAAAARGYRVSVLGLGTPAGAPYPTAEGTLGHARLESAALARLARAGNGHYAALTTDDSDLQAVGALKAGLDAQATLDAPRTGLAWQDQGYWLLPPLMLLAVFAFRRRSGVALALAACLALPLAPARAADLWRRPDQAAHARLERGNQAYRRGDYAQAAQDYAPLDGATAHYNRGNALAKAGQYQEAIDAYDQALRREPGMPDAVANKRAVEALLKRKSGAQGDNTGRQDQQGGSQSSKPSTGPSSRPGGPPPPAASANAKRDTPQPQTSPPPPAASKSPAPAPAKPADAQAQREADRAQRERIERALREAGRNGNQAQARAPKPAETPEQRERRLANEAWLRRIPDDPGGLLRTKFRLEHERRQAQGRAP